MMQQDILEQELQTLLSKFNDSHIKYASVVCYQDGAIKAYSSHHIEERELEILKSTFLREPVIPRPHSLTSGGSSSCSEDDSDYKRNLTIGPMQMLDLTNESEVKSYLRKCFIELQQLPCKAISKAWIKTIEPKKQTRYPYKLEDSSKPPWWPAQVRHVQPDHLLKEERLELMIHMVLRSPVPIEQLRDSLNMIELAKYRSKIVNEVLLVAEEVHAHQETVISVKDLTAMKKSSSKKSQSNRRRDSSLKSSQPECSFTTQSDTSTIPSSLLDMEIDNTSEIKREDDELF